MVREYENFTLKKKVLEILFKPSLFIILILKYLNFLSYIFIGLVKINKIIQFIFTCIPFPFPITNLTGSVNTFYASYDIFAEKVAENIRVYLSGLIYPRIECIYRF